MTRVAVIGRGLIGAAAARYLAKAGHETLLIGPDEPTNNASYEGPFGSHYDEARITRRLDPNPFWSKVAEASIARYPNIEIEGDARFYIAAGALMTGPGDEAMVRGIRKTQAVIGDQTPELDRTALSERFGFLAFPEGTVGFHETKSAGYVNPRRLLLAQCNAAQMHGANIVRHPVGRITEMHNGVQLEIDNGIVEMDQVLVAAGAYTNSLLPDPLDLTVYARTVALLEVGTAESARLCKMPSMVYRFPDGRDPYLLPPIPYPDGRTYLKIGGDPENLVLETATEIGAWLRSGGNMEVATYLAGIAKEIIPGLAIKNLRAAACPVMFTSTGLPYIDRITSRISVATGGCGAGAKCSDELGRLGAEAVQGRVQPELKTKFKGIRT